MLWLSEEYDVFTLYTVTPRLLLVLVETEMIESRESSRATMCVCKNTYREAELLVNQFSFG